MLAAFSVFKWCGPETDEPQAEGPSPTVTTQEAPSTLAPEDPPSTMAESDSNELPDVVSVCPTQVIEGFASDYTGGAWATQVTPETTIEVTCGIDAGTYKLFAVDFENLYEEPDLILETCGDPYCTGAYGFVTLEEI